MWGSFGRRPLDAPRAEGAPRTTAEYFARAAHAEALSIGAFRQLAQDLEELAAPAQWVAEARNAAREEARHAREALRFARALGFRGRVGGDGFRRAKRRGSEPFSLALENATGGCVNELFGAWLQLFQARFAPQAELRASARRIARDEANHAAFAFRLFHWLNEQLTPEERRRVREAMRQQIEIHASSGELPADIADRLGLPDAAALRIMGGLVEGALVAMLGPALDGD
jgi:hypothetical protein